MKELKYDSVDAAMKGLGCDTGANGEMTDVPFAVFETLSDWANDSNSWAMEMLHFIEHGLRAELEAHLRETGALDTTPDNNPGVNAPSRGGPETDLRLAAIDKLMSAAKKRRNLPGWGEKATSVAS